MINKIMLFLYKYRKNIDALFVVIICFIFSNSFTYADAGNFTGSVHQARSNSNSSLDNSPTSVLFVFPEILFRLIFKENPILAVILFTVFICFILYLRKSSPSYDSEYDDNDDYDYDDDIVNTSTLINNSIPNEHKEDAILSSILVSDENFDVNKFKARVGNMFVTLQEAFEKKDWKRIRPYESDILFNIHYNELKEYLNKNQTNVIDNICVKNIALKDFYINKNTNLSNIEVIIDASFVNYIKENRTGKILLGNSTELISVRYKWTLTRKEGIKSKTEEKFIKADSCPNCGAPISIGESGECKYCHSIVTSGEYDWMLSLIEK